MRQQQEKQLVSSQFTLLVSFFAETAVYGLGFLIQVDFEHQDGTVD